MAGISNKTMAAVAAVVIIIAAVAAYVVMDGRDGSEDTVSLSVCDTFRYGDSIMVSNASGPVYEYVVTEVVGDSYVVSMSMSAEEGTTVFAGTLDRAALVDEFVLSDTSGYTEAGTVQIDSVYGWVDVTRYSMSATVDGITVTSVYDVETSSGVLIGYTTTIGEVSTSYTVESTMVDVDGSHRDVQTIETTTVTYTEGYEVGMEYYANSMYVSLDGSYLAYFQYLSTILSISDDGYTVETTIYDDAWEPSTFTRTYTAAELRSMLDVSDGDWYGHTLTEVGTATIVTNYGYVECTKYSYEEDGVTTYLYADPGSGSVLMILSDTEYRGVQCMHCYTVVSANLS